MYVFFLFFSEHIINNCQPSLEVGFQSFFIFHCLGESLSYHIQHILPVDESIDYYHIVLKYEITSLKHDSLQKAGDRKSTRLNSSHVSISYAVFCLKKKK